MHIRQMTDRDKPAWLEMRRQLWPHCPEEEHQAEIAEQLASDRLTAFLADQDGEAVGFLEVSIHENAHDEAGRCGYMEGWFVLEEFRGQGAGRQLAEAAERWAAASGLNRMASDAEESNRHSRRVHEALDYREIAVRDGEAKFIKDIKQIVTYGDAFIDYFSKGTDNTAFNRHLGGATVNVAAGAGRLGLPSAFITVTGDDEDSRFFREQLRRENVNLEFAVEVPEKRVSGVYVHLTPEFDRVFASYENETPDIQVTSADLSVAAFGQASAFHFCSGTMFQPEALETTRSAVRLAKQHGALCSFDVNIRPLRWDSEDECRRTVNDFLRQADIVKMTMEELAFLTETESFDEGLDRLAACKIPLLFITDGANGTHAISGDDVIHVPVVPVQPVDTTGAGDAFVAGVLRHIHLYGLPETRRDIVRCAAFGNKLGALCTTKKGALTAMPRLEEVRAFLEEETG